MRLEEVGLYWILSIGRLAMPITDITAIISNTENDEIPLISLCHQESLSFDISNNKVPAEQTD